MAQYPLVDQDHFIEASWSHLDTVIGSIPMDEWSVRHQDLYLTTHNTHKRPIFIPPAEFYSAIPASKQP